MYAEGKRIELIIGGRNIIAEIYTDEKGARIPIRPICEAIGVDHDGQARKLKSNPNFGCQAKLATGVDGKTYQMDTLPIDEIGGWLFSINSNRVKAEVAPILLVFQRHCQVELHAAITGNAGTALVLALKQQVETMAQQVSELRGIILAQNETIKPLATKVLEHDTAVNTFADSAQYQASQAGKGMAMARRTKSIRDTRN